MVRLLKHRRFSLRCLSDDVTLVSVKLKPHQNTLRVPYHQKAERQLLNEHIGSINNTLELYKYQKEAYTSQLKEKLDQSSMEECQDHIKSVLKLDTTKYWNAKGLNLINYTSEKWLATQTQT